MAKPTLVPPISDTMSREDVLEYRLLVSEEQKHQFLVNDAHRQFLTAQQARVGFVKGLLAKYGMTEADTFDLNNGHINRKSVDNGVGHKEA